MLSLRRPSTDSSTTTRSMRTDTTWRYSVFGPDRLGRGPMLFTGPDGIRDHRVAVDAEHRYVGEGTMSPEGTSQVDYLWRAPRAIPFPRPKSHSVGEIGWGIPEQVDWSSVVNGNPIRPDSESETLGEFRQMVADRHSHLYQNAWYPRPEQPSSRSHVFNVYKPKTAMFDRYGRRLPAATKTYTSYGGDAPDNGYRTSTRSTSRVTSASSVSERGLYSHYADPFSRPKTAFPHY